MILSIRKALPVDEQRVFELSNDPDVRENSFSNNKISFDEHKKWFQNILSSDNVLFYLFFDNTAFVAQIRFKKCNDCQAEISISIEREYRGKHIGTTCLEMAIAELKKEWGLCQIVALVKEANASSNRFFINNKFDFIESFTENNIMINRYSYRIK